MDPVHRKIPGASHTYSKGDDQFPSTAPRRIARGKGYVLWDEAGRPFVDWTMGLASVSLGHANEEVAAAAARWLPLGSNFARPTALEEELADAILALGPRPRMVKFGKHGSDGTSSAVRLARAFTGRDRIVACSSNPFYSVHDWWIGTTLAGAGVPDAIRSLTHTFPYGDLAALDALLERYGREVALVIVEPAATVPAAAQCRCAHCLGGAGSLGDCAQAHFWRQVAERAHAAGALFALDENKTGFRMALPGAEQFYALHADMVCYGKALANGFSVSAIAGREDLLDQGGILQRDRDRVFLLSATHGGETHSLAAAIKTVEIMRRDQVPAHMWRIGGELSAAFNAECRAAGLEATFALEGYPCFPSLTVNAAAPDVDALRTLLLQEMARQGVIFNFVAPALAHDAEAVARTREAARAALATCRQAIDTGRVPDRLEGPLLRPVFRRRN
jgi:glutamate-1-semialdehyde 2,1-aminomutase